jgi:hypothetical protein
MLLHLIIGIVLLLLVTGVVWFYTLVPLAMMILIRSIKRYVPYYRLKKDKRSEKPPALFEKYDKVVAIALLVLVIFANTGAYMVQRKQWMGADNANLSAKQYFVVGQVVYFYRRAISSFLWHPDAYELIGPLSALQRLIYTIGIRQLPNEDAEEAVWAEQWFVYIYSHRMVVAGGAFSDYGDLGENMLRGANGKSLTVKEAERGEVPLLPADNEYFDLVWHCLETMATKEFADREMREHHYLRNYAGMAHYYAYKSPRAYTKVFLGYQPLYAQMEEMTRRNEKLVNWLSELPDKWQQSAEVSSFIQQHSKVDAMRQMALLMTLVNIFDARVWAHEFSCDDPYLKRLYKVREEFSYGVNGETPAYLRMNDKRTAEQFRKVAIDSSVARFTNLVAEKLCGKKLAGEENMREFEGEAISTEDSRKQMIRALFPKELELLNMTDVLEEKYWTKTPHGYEFR